MEKGEDLADEHHVLRYVKPSYVDGAHIGTAAFLCRAGESECSVNWMERFDAPVTNQYAHIRVEKRITYAATARVVRLNVGTAKKYILEEAETALAFLYDPEDPDPPKFPNAHTSHSIITGMPKLETPEGEMVGALLRDCIPESDVYAVTAG